MIVKDDQLIAFISLNNNHGSINNNNNISNGNSGGKQKPSLSSSVNTTTIIDDNTNPRVLYDEITRHVKKTLPHYMVPKSVRLVKGEFPQTANGKLDKLSLATMIDTDTRIISSSSSTNINNLNNHSIHSNKNDVVDELIPMASGMSMATFLIRSEKA